MLLTLLRCARKKRRRLSLTASVKILIQAELRHEELYLFVSLEFNSGAVRTASVARVGVGKGAGAPRNSERRPLTRTSRIKHADAKLYIKFHRNLQNKILSLNPRLAEFIP